MGRASTKENKNLYFTTREGLGLTRDEASDLLEVIPPERIEKIENETGKKPLMFYPDEGAGKRYSGMIPLPYCFGIKKRDWKTGQILGLDVAGDIDSIAGKNILIVDDIC